MSGGGEDTKNLNEEGENPTATLSRDIPNSSQDDISGGCNLKDLQKNPPAISNITDDSEDIGDIEAIIEKKLPSDKEKALDVDSELDFELKWDDDNEMSLDSTPKELKSDLTSGKDIASTENDIQKVIDSLDKEIDSAFTSTEKDLVDIDKDTDSDLTSVEKDLDSLHQESDSALTLSEKNLDNDEIESNKTSVGKHLVNTEQESKITSDEVLETLDKETENAFTATDTDLDTLEKEIENTCIDKNPGNADDVTESSIASVEKELDKEIEPVKTTTEKQNTCVGKDPNNAGDEAEGALASVEKELDKEIEQALATTEKQNMCVGKDPNNAGDVAESALAFVEKELDKEIEQALATTEKQSTLDMTDSKVASLDLDLDINVNAMDVDIVDEEIPLNSENNYPDTLHKHSDDELLKILDQDKTINVENDAKTDIELKTSQNESETNSLDEELVYSDAEANLEDKDLMEEIDTQITTTEINSDNLKNTDTTQISSMPSIIQKESVESKTTIKDASNMDIDPGLTKSVTVLEKSDANDTFSSATDLELSTYDINQEHGLDRPDVMIDIPTQELIDTFDDFEETSEITEDIIGRLDESTTKTTDFNETTTSKDPIQYVTDSQALEDKTILEKVSDDVNESNNEFDKLLTDKTETAVVANKSSETTQIESMDVDPHDALAEIDKQNEENVSEMKSQVTNSPDQEHVNTLQDEVSHADIILEATTESKHPVDTSGLEQEVNKGDNDSPQTLNVEPSSSMQVDKDIEQSDNFNPKDTEVMASADEPQPSTSTKEAKDVKSSDQREDTQKPNDEAHPSTSNHLELSDEDQETSDSLGLLAESSRVMEDDDEQEQEAEPDDEDEDDEFDQDEESNQMTAEHSEDSNAQQSEADVPKEAMDVDESNDAQESTHEMTETDDAVEDFHGEDDHDSNDEKVESNDEKVESNDEKDDSNDERDELDQIQIGDVVSAAEVADVPSESTDATEEPAKTVALLEDKKKESEDTLPAVVSVKEKDAAKPTEPENDAASSKLRKLLLQDGDSTAQTTETEKKSPSKTKKLEISKPKNEINIVELEESSSEDDIQVVNKQTEKTSPLKDVTSVNIPSEVEVLVAGASSDVQQKPGELLISGLPKPSPQKPARLNTDEVTIKTTPAATEPLVIPEAKAPKSTDGKAAIDFGLEIFSLDSDDEETEVRSTRKSKLTAIELDKARQINKCINMQCTSEGSVPLVPATMAAAVYYAANQQRGGGLCLNCAQRFEERSEKLVEGVKELTPFLAMDMCLIREEFVEISDSDSEEEQDVVKDDAEIIGEKGAKFLEEQLADAFNDVWKKYNMEERLLAAQAEINVEVGQLEEECKQIDAMLNECQKETDKLRNDLYTAFADDRRELPAITICDTPTNQWSGLEDSLSVPLPPQPAPEVRELPARQKRRGSGAPEPAPKRAAIPLGYAPLDNEPKPEPKPGPSAEVAAPNDDDNADISVVKLSVEAAPAGLPPPGTATRPPLRPNMLLFAMRNTFGAWHKVKVTEVQPKLAGQFTTCRVRFEQPKTMTKLLPARCLAYADPPDVRLTIGTRVIALFKDHRTEKKEEAEKKEAYYSGIVAEIPNPVNSFRYLIFFDDGYAQYVQHAVTRLVCECAPRVWDEVHPFSRQFVRDYLRAYPERPMVRLHAGQSIKTEWDGKWWVSKVLEVDASLVLVYFEGKKENKTEWIYRGSTRLAPLYLELQAAERTRARPLPRAQAARRFNMPYVEYTRSDENAEKPAPQAAPAATPQTQAQFEQEIRRQRAVAKKSTAPATMPAHPPPPPAPVPRDNVTSRVVFYTPKNAIKPHKMVPHTCGPKCKRTDVLALKDLRTYNPLTKPLLSGWERQQVRYRIPAVKAIMYRAPCGRRIRDYRELHQYLQAIDSDMGVDLFDFNPSTHCLAEFLLNKCLISKKDLSHGKENVPVPCVNYYDSSLPEFCSYNTERTPTAGVPLNLDPEFLCGCDCTDDCADKSKCACWQMTLEGARTIGLDTDEVGYVYKRLPEPLPSGIYECNIRCKCKQTCLNRVAQHPLQLKLQVFKTANRGWGIRALNDVPKGAFLCVYAGNLLTDATANLDGLNEGDEYLAELDYIEVVEQMKEGFEEDIPEDAKKLDEEEGSTSSMSSEEEPDKKDADDDDFRPAMPAGQYTRSEYSKRLRKREKSKAKEEKERKEKEEKQKEKDGDDCITISDDEELREPAHFAAQTGMKGKEFVSKYKSVRAHFGKDEACYIMDAKVQGNIGRYLNHSCTPNVFVQNVFVDTHDPRFPWVAFFALSQIRAGTELTWNYNYDIGSVPGKVLYCYCNAPNCRGRLL